MPAPLEQAVVHVHKFTPDPTMGADEMQCRCGLWQCKYRDKRSGKRCPEAAQGILDYCLTHKRHQRAQRLTGRHYDVLEEDDDATERDYGLSGLSEEADDGSETT